MKNGIIILITSFILGSLLFPAAAGAVEAPVENESGLSSMYGVNGEYEIYSVDNIEIPASNNPELLEREKQYVNASKQTVFLKNSQNTVPVCQKNMTQFTFTSNNTIHTKCKNKLLTVTNIIRERILLRVAHISATQK
ncbi:hypothetical protein [Lysinibacillus sp. 3P01SB]|uniref:hypothetical protein n=1 Tax=Lysinibacillus sp. 3P01SB TaxID=3132284 RepID=UPI0039A66139